MRRSIGNSFSRVGTILHLGAGQPPPIQDYLSAGCEHLVLIDPDPAVVRAIARIGSSRGGVRAVCATPALRDGEGREVALYAYRLADAEFLAPSEAAAEPETRLCTGRSLRAPTLDIPEMLEQAALPPDGAHWLVVDTPGGRAALLQRLSRHGALDLFSYVSIIAGRWTWGSQDESEALCALEDAGFHLLRQSNHAGALFHHATRGRLWKVHQDILAELQSIRGEVERLAAERETLVGNVSKAEDENSEAMSRLRNRLERMASDVSALKDKNRGLEGENERHRLRETQLANELALAESQMALIKELSTRSQDTPR